MSNVLHTCLTLRFEEINNLKSVSDTVVDTGFPRRGVQHMNFERKPIIWQDFSQELHENERNFTAGRTLSALLDSQMRYFFSELRQVTNLHETPTKFDKRISWPLTFALKNPRKALRPPPPHSRAPPNHPPGNWIFIVFM